jgi:hypothetical protein
MNEEDVRTGSGGKFKYISYELSDNMVCQEKPMSCVQACVRQLLKDDGVYVDEDFLINQSSFSEQYGTDFVDIVPLLNRLHPARKFDGGVPGLLDKEPDEMAVILTEAKKKWVARLKPSQGSAHSVIVDDIQDGVVTIRDPWGNGAGTEKGAVAKMTLKDFCELWANGVYYSIW